MGKKELIRELEKANAELKIWEAKERESMEEDKLREKIKEVQNRVKEIKRRPMSKVTKKVGDFLDGVGEFGDRVNKNLGGDDDWGTTKSKNKIKRTDNKIGRLSKW